MRLKIAAITIILLFAGSSIVSSISINFEGDPPTVNINIDSYSTIYEGDIVNCTITGNPNIKYWQINDGEPHYTFYENNPIIYDPEPTPLNSDYVDLKINVENEFGYATDTVQVKIKRIYFGDIHWHTDMCDGDNSINKMYKNAINDNYLDFTSCTNHAEWIDNLQKKYWNLSVFFSYPEYWYMNFKKLRLFLQNIKQHELSEWDIIKSKANQYYEEGKFSTLLGFEWTACDYPNFHINFYYRDVYDNAKCYTSSNVAYDINRRDTLDDILQTMSEEWDEGHMNIGFPHHPLFIPINWTVLIDNVSDNNREKIIRGVEAYSKWGTAIGKYTPNLPINWPYYEYYYYEKDDPLVLNSWVENSMWEISENSMKDQKFAILASSDTHQRSRPGSANPETGIRTSICYNPSGIVATYAVHNNREEIWDAMNDCDMYGTQLLKIRTNVRFNGEMALGRWINCTSPLKIQVTVQSTFPGLDRSGKSMSPHAYSSWYLDYPIEDIWLIKKDTENGKPWCKIINHTSPNERTAVAIFEDHDVKPNDFYWIAIRQKGMELTPKISPLIYNLIRNIFVKWEELPGERNEYMAFIGPVFIDSVNEEV